MNGKVVLIILLAGGGLLVGYFFLQSYEGDQLSLARTQLAIAQQNTQTAKNSHASLGDIVLGGIGAIGKGLAAL